MINKKPFELNGQEEDCPRHGLLAHFSGFIPMSRDLAKLILAHVSEPVTYNKATVVLKPGEVAQMAYWPVEGYIRAFIEQQPETDRDFFEQQTIDISLPGRVYLPLNSFMNQDPSDYYLEIAKGSTMISFSYASFMELGMQIPEVFLLGNRIIAAAEMDWLKKMEIYKVFHQLGYKTFLKLFGARAELYLLQKQIASYVGMRADELTRIKREIRRRRGRGC